MKNDPLQTALAELNDATPAQLAKALSSKWNLVTAKSAKLAEERHLTELQPQLLAAFDRLLPHGATKDKGCSAMTAIARALIAFEYDDPDLFRRGLRHVQKEPVWGGSEDTAVDLRATCAIGLANTRDTRRMRDLVELLTDQEWGARVGAVRGIAAVGGEPAILLLRYKILTGDAHEDVQYECFTSLLELEGAEALPLIRRVSSEPAILALGASRRPDALQLLKELHEQTRDPARLACILLAISSSRLDEAIDFLLNEIRSAPQNRAKAAEQAMSIHRHDEPIARRLREAIRS